MLDCTNGLLVNVSSLGAPPGVFNEKFSELCVCDNSATGFSGACDLFDTRVAHYQGLTYSLSCKNSNIGTYVIYSLLLVILLRKLCYSVVAFHKRVKSRGLKKWYTHVPYLLLIIDGCGSTSLLITFCCLKLIDTQRVIGTDVALTLLFLLGSAVGIFTIVIFSAEGLHVIVKGQAFRVSEQSQKILNLHRRLNLLILCCYFAITAIPRLVMLGLDKSVGPINNGQYIVLIIANMGIIFWSVLQLLTAFIMTKEATKLVAMVDANAMSSQNVGEIIKYLKDLETKHFVTVLLSTAIYVLACVPFFWYYQMYVFMTLLSLANFVGVIGKIYLHTSKLQKEAPAQGGTSDERSKTKSEKKQATTTEVVVSKSIISPSENSAMQ